MALLPLSIRPLLKPEEDKADMDIFLPQTDKLSRTIQQEAADLMNRLRTLQVEKLGLPYHCLEYFKSSHFRRLFFSIETSAHLLHRSISLTGKAVEDIVIMDYGAGVGTLYMLAKMIGCRTVIYNDHLEDWKISAVLIAEAIGVDAARLHSQRSRVYTEGSSTSQTDGSMKSQTEGRVTSQTEGRVTSDTDGSITSHTKGNTTSHITGSTASSADGSLPPNIEGTVRSYQDGNIASPAQGGLTSHTGGSAEWNESVQRDEYIVGDIRDTLEVLKAKNIQCDIITSRNVIEHIYDLNEFFTTINAYQPNAIIYSSTTANYHNPAAHIKHILWHRKWEKQFLPQRAALIRKELAGLAEAEVQKLAKATRGLALQDFDAAVAAYRANKSLPDPSLHHSNTVETSSGVWFEHLLPFKEYRMMVPGNTYDLKFEPGFWDTHNTSKLKNMLGMVLNPVVKATGAGGIRLAPFIYVIALPKTIL